MISYAIAQWKDFLIAVSSVAASFAGLLFVGVSINLTRILGTPGIPARAGETLIFLGGVLVAALLGLVPQPPLAFGLGAVYRMLRARHSHISPHSSAPAASL